MKKMQLTYVYDALCGWCFGFSDVMDQIHAKYKDHIEFEVVSGGLFTGNRVGLINDIAPYIKAGAYKSVEERTGVQFGNEFLNKALQNNTMLLNSLPPAIALCIVKEHSPEKAMEFASKLLKTFYIEGTSSDAIEKYAVLAEEIGMDRTEFMPKMEDDKYKTMAMKEFAFCASLQVNGFPSVILGSGDDKNTISNGFVDFDTFDKKLSQFVVI